MKQPMTAVTVRRVTSASHSPYRVMDSFQLPARAKTERSLDGFVHAPGA